MGKRVWKESVSQSGKQMGETKLFYRRNLPHLQPQTGTFFITFRLVDSISNLLIKQLQEQQVAKERNISQNTPFENWHTEIQNSRKRYFAIFDAHLDTSPQGNQWLKNPEIARIVADAMHFRNQKEYDLIAYCIMSNHVHMVVSYENYPQKDKQLYHTLQSLKRHTATQCNKILARRNSFWQKESYDHLARNNEELKNIVRYVLNNPVKIGLVNNWQDWRFSYVHENYT
jgi:putative transposase